MEVFPLGIDISKAKFDLALLRYEGKLRHKVFPNTEAGFQQLSAWLSKLKVFSLLACMEATGSYGEALALYLYRAGHRDEQISHTQSLIRDHIDQIPSLKQQRDLLSSIPGIGDLTAAKLLSEIIVINHYQSARQVAPSPG